MAFIQFATGVLFVVTIVLAARAYVAQNHVFLLLAASEELLNKIAERAEKEL